MGMFLRVFTVLCLVKISHTGNSVDVLTPRTLSELKDDEILRVLSRNKTESSDNFTFIELIGNLRNHTVDTEKDMWKIGKLEILESNPYYDEFPEEIDTEARRFLQIVPPYDPGAGSVSAECKRHADVFHQELNKFTLWALKMYDATAKIPSGLLSGNVNQLGDFDECVGIEGTQGIQGQYCLAYLQFEVDQSRPDLKHLHRLLHSHYAFKSNVTDPGHRIPRYSTINWAVCTPASCTHHDVETSLRDVLTRYTMQTGLKISVQVDQEMCQVKNREPIPMQTVLVSIFFVTIFALTIVAAYYDHRDIPTSELLLAFSLKRNFKRLVSLERKEGDIATLHGIRAFNAFMLLMSHKSMALFFIPYVNRTEMGESVGKPWTVIGRAASLYTDPFIMLSGLLTTYSFIGRLKKNGNLDIRNEYLSRLLRLVPTLGALILFCTHVMPYIGSGPQWNLVVTQHASICKQTWWRNFLFIHNYFGFENMCLTHTHHVGIDTQLFVFSPLMVMLIYKMPMIGTVVLVLIALLSTVLRFYVTYVNQLSNYIYFGESIKQLFDTANLSYILPSHRLTVYIIGIFLGYLLRHLPKDLKLSKTFIYTGWILCTTMCFAAFFGPVNMGSIDYIYNPIHAATYNALAPIGWCAIFGWVVIMHHTGNTNGWLSRFLSWKGFIISTRLSYGIYLTQFPVFFYNVGQARNADYYEFFRLVFNLQEYAWVAFTSAVLTLLFDTPFQNLKNCLLKKSDSSVSTRKSSKIE